MVGDSQQILAHIISLKHKSKFQISAGIQHKTVFFGRKIVPFTKRTTGPSGSIPFLAP